VESLFYLLEDLLQLLFFLQFVEAKDLVFEEFLKEDYLEILVIMLYLRFQFYKL
jgi:hypothetical protein